MFPATQSPRAFAELQRNNTWFGRDDSEFTPVLATAPKNEAELARWMFTCDGELTHEGYAWIEASRRGSLRVSEGVQTRAGIACAPILLAMLIGMLIWHDHWKKWLLVIGVFWLMAALAFAGLTVRRERREFEIDRAFVTVMHDIAMLGDEEWRQLQRRGQLQLVGTEVLRAMAVGVSAYFGLSSMGSG